MPFIIRKLRTVQHAIRDLQGTNDPCCYVVLVMFFVTRLDIHPRYLRKKRTT